MKKALSIIKDVLVWAIVVAAVAMMIFTIVSVSTFDRNDRDVFGFKAFIVLSDSMSATHFNAGDLIIVKEVDPSTLMPGDVISYQSLNPENYGETVTHMIKERTTDASGNPGFVTYGTTTGDIDDTIVTYSFVLGKYQFRLPQVGTFFHYLKSPQGYIVCILIPFLLLILLQGIKSINLFRRYKQEQAAELDAERKQIEEERQEAQRMMAELLALKAQLANPSATIPVAPEGEDEMDELVHDKSLLEDEQ
jgi:signal peptidase